MALAKPYHLCYGGPFMVGEFLVFRSLLTISQATFLNCLVAWEIRAKSLAYSLPPREIDENVDSKCILRNVGFSSKVAPIIYY